MNLRVMMLSTSIIEIVLYFFFRMMHLVHDVVLVSKSIMNFKMHTWSMYTVHL